ncbi:MAG TPA: tetratricopeptide repeat protein, partial [Telluria sp.]|nr:tetratricopeptide repeat protein [Telluria sp.]
MNGALADVIALFARPWWLAALLPVALIFWRLARQPQCPPAWTRAIDAHLLPHLLAGGLPQGRRLGVSLVAGALVIAVLALAGPLLPGQQERALRRDAVRVLVVELSPASAPQLEQIRATLLALLHALPDGQTALIVYADEPYLIVPPTTDINNIARFVPELAADALPVPGNRPERALRMADQLLARSAAPARDLIWITAATDAGALSRLHGTRVSILHAGAAAPALADHARRSGGVFVRMEEGDAGQKLAAALSARGGWIDAARMDSNGMDGGYWLALALLPLAALAFRRGVLTMVGPLIGPLLCAALLAPPPGEAVELPLPPALADYRAWRLLEAGDPDQAARHFTDRRWRAAASYRAGEYAQAAALLEGARDADSLYNRGNALAKQGRLADALASYDAALALRPQDADA